MPPTVVESVIAPIGPQASAIARLWWVMLGTTAAVFVVVIAAVLIAILRSRARAADDVALHDGGITTAVSGATIVTAVILFGLLGASMWAQRTVNRLGAPTAVSIQIVGHQWWWEVEYEDAVPARRVKTANEIHVPVGQPVVLKLTSRDVIHSFWAPNIQGKRDLIPGITSAIWVQADRPGVYSGQCAEFCGKQHAHMAFRVVAEPPAVFARWLEQQRALAQEPRGKAEQHGREVFVTHSCVTCHTIRGLDAYATVGPDLTHVASRGSIAAATLPNSRGHLGGWIVDPQAIKPGAAMPPNALSGDELNDLLMFMETLK